MESIHKGSLASAVGLFALALLVSILAKSLAWPPVVRLIVLGLGLGGVLEQFGVARNREF